LDITKWRWLYAAKEAGQASFRPSGLAMGHDGALYISEVAQGRIWPVTYHGAADVTLMPAPSPKIAGVTSGEPGPPEGSHPDAGRAGPAALPVPPGATKEEVALGDRIFHGEAAGGTRYKRLRAPFDGIDATKFK
jgi:hypothetical protein